MLSALRRLTGLNPQDAKVSKLEVAKPTANKSEIAPEGTGKAIYAAANRGDAAELSKLVEPRFANPFLNDYSDGGLTPLIIASMKGHIECVKILATQPGIELNKGRRFTQTTALYCASNNGHVDIVKLLCSLPGIDVNKTDKNDKTPYAVACENVRGYYDESEQMEKQRENDIQKILISSGANERKKLTRNTRNPLFPPGTGEAMYKAAEDGNSDKLLKLVKLRFALNDYSGGYGNRTPLMVASINGHIKCVKILAAQPGIELNKCDRSSQSTALLFASSNGNVDIVEFLCSLRGIDVNKADKHGRTPYAMACKNYYGENKDTMKSAIEKTLKLNGATEGETEGVTVGGKSRNRRVKSRRMLKKSGYKKTKKRNRKIIK